MGWKCAVPHCSTNKSKCTKGLSNFKVPSDDCQREKWIAAIPTVTDLRVTQRICERHFEEDLIIREYVQHDKTTGKVIARLCQGAVPTIFENNSFSTSPHQTLERRYVEMDHTYALRTDSTVAEENVEIYNFMDETSEMNLRYSSDSVENCIKTDDISYESDIDVQYERDSIESMDKSLNDISDTNYQSVIKLQYALENSTYLGTTVTFEGVTFNFDFQYDEDKINTPSYLHDKNIIDNREQDINNGNSDDEDKINTPSYLHDKNIIDNREQDINNGNSEDHSINFQQGSYIKEEVMISDVSDFSDNEISNDNNVLRKHNTSFKNVKKSKNKLLPEDNVKTKQTTKEYKCTKCGGRYKGRKYLQIHQRICGVPPFLQCEFCNYKTRFRKNLKRHLNAMHKDLKTDEIQKILDRAKMKEYKMRGRIPFIKLYCSKCKVTYERNKFQHKKCLQCLQLITHLQCFKCDKRYATPKSMYFHLKSKCESKKCFQCADCDYRSFSKRYLQSHIYIRHRTMAPEDYKKCVKCDKAFKRRSDQVMHEKRCSQMQCQFCHYKSNNKRIFKMHVQKHILQQANAGATISADAVGRRSSTFVKIPAFQNECTKCGRRYKYDYNLKRHLRLCGLAPFLQCEFCDYKAKQNLRLKIHLLKKHKDLKAGKIEQILDTAKAKEHKMFGKSKTSTRTFDYSPFIKLYCSKCKVSIEEDKLNNQRCPRCCESPLLQCLKCDKRYAKRDSMYVHLKTKCGPEELFFQCANCDYQTGLKFDLRVHMVRMHMTVAPEDFERCGKCDKCFKLRCDRRAHERRCGKQPDLQCELCTFRCQSKAYFENHVKHHEPIPANVDAIVDADSIDRIIGHDVEMLDYVPEFDIAMVPSASKPIKMSKAKDETSRLLELFPVYCSTCDVMMKAIDGEMKCSRCATNSASTETTATESISFKVIYASLKDYIKMYCSKHNMNFEESKLNNLKCPQCSELALLQCLKCNRRYTKHASMHFHLARKCEPKEYLHCADCNFRANTKSHLIDHRKRRHMTVAPENLEKCGKCGTAFKHPTDLQCEFCHFRNKHKGSLKMHMQNHILQQANAGATFNVNAIDKTSSSIGIEYPENDVISFKLESYIKEEVMISDMSDYSENQVSDNDEVMLQTHILLTNLKNSRNELPPEADVKTKHYTTEQNKCTKCDRRFKYIYNLRKHQRMCGLTPFLPCEFCDYKASCSDNLKKHLKRMHKYLKEQKIQKIIDTAKTEESNMLGYPCKSRSTWSYINFVKLYCSKCDVNLDRNNMKNRKCPQCSELALLQCLKCDRRYANHSSMYNHLRSKCGPKEYLQCADCEQKFHAKSHLLLHIMRKHTTVAPEDFEKCRRCGKGFRICSDRNRHEKQCGKEPEFQCEVCPCRYKSRSHLKTHVMQRHKTHPANIDAIVYLDSIDETTVHGVVIADCTPKSDKATVPSASMAIKMSEAKDEKSNKISLSLFYFEFLFNNVQY